MVATARTHVASSSLLGICVVCCISVWACGDDFEPTGAPAGTSGAAGDGGGAAGAGGATAGAGGATAGAGGATAGAGGGGTAGSGPCEPGTQQACYGGPSGTSGVGICKPGTQICAADGTGFGECQGQVVPAAEDCTKPEDEDCDGVVCSALLWAKLAGDGQDQMATAVASDASGNVYVAGIFMGTIDFGQHPLTSSTTTTPEVYLVKLDPSGSVVWAAKFKASSAWDLAVDGAGNVVMAGRYENPVQFGTISLAVANKGYVVKISPDGVPLWAKELPVRETFEPRVAIGPSNRVYAVYAQPTGTGGTGAQIALSIFEASGSAISSVSFGSSGPSVWAHPSDVAVDATGNAFVTASFQGDLWVGAQTLTSAGKDDAALFKVAPGLGALWALQFGGPEDDAAAAVALDPTSGQVRVVGRFKGTAKVAGAELTSVSSADLFLVAVSTGGTVSWRKQFGSLIGPTPKSIAVDANGNIALSGIATSGVDFGGGELTGAFVAKLTGSGDHVWSKGFGTAAYGWDVAFDAAGNVLLGGITADSIDFGGGVLTAQGGTDAWIAKFAP
jgi:hypothetical protein